MNAASRQIPYARAVSEIGNSLRYIALPLGILRARGRAQDLAVAEVLETLGFFAAGLLAPFFIDRVSRLRALVCSDLGALGVTGLMVYAIAAQSLPWLLAAAFLMTFVDTFYSGSLSAVIASVHPVTENERGRSLLYGFSRLQLYTLIGGLVGSLAGTRIVNMIPLWSMLVVDGVTFLVSSVWIYWLARSVSQLGLTPSRPSRARSLGALIAESVQEWVEGFRAAIRNPEALRHILAQSVIGIAHGLLAASVIGHYKETLNATDSKVALAQSNNRVWQFFGAIFAFRSKRAPRDLILVGTLLMGAGYLGMGFLPFYGFLAAYGAQQLGNAILTPANRAVSLLGSTPETLGRVATFRGLMIDVGVLTGNALAVVIVAQGGTRWSFWLAAMLSCASLLIIGLPQGRRAAPSTSL